MAAFLRHPIDLVPLSRAVLCLDCNRISASTGPCRGCGSHAVLQIERVLNARSRATQTVGAQISAVAALKPAEAVAIIHTRSTRRAVVA